MESITASEFDEWSAAWHANKVRKPNCTVVYKCQAMCPSGAPCQKTASKKVLTRTCWNHRNALLLLKKPLLA